MTSKYRQSNLQHPSSSPADDTTTKSNRSKSERVRDTAARLFAELFYRQVMEERAAKRKQEEDKKIDGKPPKSI